MRWRDRKTDRMRGREFGRDHCDRFAAGELVLLLNEDPSEEPQIQNGPGRPPLPHSVFARSIENVAQHTHAKKDAVFVTLTPNENQCIAVARFLPLLFVSASFFYLSLSLSFYLSLYLSVSARSSLR